MKVFKHRLTKHPLYSIWRGIKTRCYNKNYHHYKDYGGRGIEMCEEWKDSFIIFYSWAIIEGWKEGLNIDRINNDGNYEPNNCRFVNDRVSVSNRRNNSIYGTGIYKSQYGKFKVQIFLNGKRKSCGSYKTLEEARKAYQNEINGLIAEID